MYNNVYPKVKVQVRNCHSWSVHANHLATHCLQDSARKTVTAM